MNAKKKVLVLLVAVMVLSLATVSAFADEFSNNVPSNATVYGAGTCHHGFETSRSVSKGSGWGAELNVSATYVLWDDIWEYDMYELVYAKDSKGEVTDEKKVYTGLYKLQGSEDWIVNPGTNRNNYTPYLTTLKFTKTPGSEVFLRITKPSEKNYANDYAPIDNMKVWGYFWR